MLIGALDIHFFFHLSAGRRADYEKMESVTNIVSHYAQKHVSTRWNLSLILYHTMLRNMCRQDGICH